MSIDLNIKSLNQSILIDLLAKSKIIFSAEECKVDLILAGISWIVLSLNSRLRHGESH
jgi:hypothetical protein